MLDILFFGALIVYFLAVVAQFLSLSFRREKLSRIAWIVYMAAFGLNTAYLIVRGVAAGRLPLSNQFEFATAFAWGVALLSLALRRSVEEPWLGAIMAAASFLVLSFAALQPRQVSELMPALRSGWFGFHIGSAVLSYASFMTSACFAVRYLLLEKKPDAPEERLLRLDYLAYRLIAFGFLMLTVGRAGLVRLLDLGPQGDLGADHLADLRGLSPPPAVQKMAGPADGDLLHRGARVRALHLHRRQRPLRRAPLV